MNLTKSEPRSVSWNDDLDQLITKRCSEERMTRSEFIRHCVRVESEERQRRNIQKLLTTFPHPLAA
jgi:metal-responsive CopG/Arc/MetJ family transcriptional regulator